MTENKIKKMKKIKIFTDEEKFWKEIISDFRKISPKNILASGGSSAGIFDFLKKSDFYLKNSEIKNINSCHSREDGNPDQKYSKIFLADERFVPETHKNSNAKLIREKLIRCHSREDGNPDQNKSIKNISEIFISCQPENFKTPELCAQNYAEKLPENFDIAILGVGPDGHTCSLFPNAKSLEEKNLKYLATQTEIFDIKDRITVSFPVLESAKNIFIIMKGKNKKEILEKISQKNIDFHQFPAKKVFDFPQTKIFFGDF